MSTAKSIEGNSCSIAFLAPFGKPDSDTRKRTDCVFRVFEDIATEKGYKLRRADYELDTNIITSIERIIRTADIVIADITEHNPNVFYECGLRNAIRGKIVYICCGKCESVPFDITQNRVNTYEYDQENDSLVNSYLFYKDISKKISVALSEPKTNFFDCTHEEIATFFNATVLTQYTIGTKEHYALAEKIATRKCKNIFLMQRSSSIVLGAERGWDEENTFLDTIKVAAEQCQNFCHVITLEGIRDHLERRDSIFPDFSKYAERIRKGRKGVAELNVSDPSKHFALKKLPLETNQGYFKLDRQARVFMAEFYDGMISTVIVQNLGEKQLCFWAEGNAQLSTYLRDCIDFYRGLADVKMDEISALYEAYGKPIDEEL